MVKIGATVIACMGLASLLLSPYLAFRGYLRTRDRWPRARKIWTRYGGAFALASIAFLINGIDLMSLIPVEARVIVSLAAFLLIIVAGLVYVWGAYYQGLDKLLFED
ncbi:MAG: hypothetical protein OJF49_004123 [Ktedonobacterales bacterium]|jgi:hypothetical protein|nr:MAG: hypothetical protein OJF49_004123 [Ktedonobacterales bacterium]